MSTYTICEVVGDDHQSVTLADLGPGEVTDAISEWYPEAPQDITDAIQRLDDQLSGDGHIDPDLVTFLGLEVKKN